MEEYTLHNVPLSLLTKVTDEPLIIINLHEQKVLFVDNRIAEFFKIPIGESLLFEQLCKPIDKKIIRIKAELLNNLKQELLNLPEDQRHDYVINCNIPVDNRFVDWVHLRIVPIQDNTLPSFSIFIIIATISPNSKSFFLSVENANDNNLLLYDIERHCWQSTTKISLTEEELIILRMSCVGFSMKEIADKICKSVNTVKFHIKTLNRKFKVHNFHSVIFRAMIDRLV